MIHGPLGPPHHGTDASQNLPRIAGLGHVVVSAQFESEDAVRVVAPRRQHDDRDPAVLAQFLEHVDAVHFRHHHVQHDEVQARPAQLFQRLRAIMGQAHVEALRLEVLLEQAAELGIVVREK